MNPIAIALAAVLIIAVIEAILAAKWNRTYMTQGLPIFMRRVDCLTGLDDISLEALQKSAATAAGAPLLFRRLDSDVIVFREQAFAGAIHYFALMRGVIRRDTSEPTVRVLGLIKWWAVALIAGFMLLFGADARFAAPYILGALAVLYLIQFVRFSRVAKALLRAPAAAE